MSRGTSNGNCAGSSRDRRARKAWLVATFRADVDLFGIEQHEVPRGEGQPACRCYRCGVLLTVETVTADRIKPGIDGGTYKRSNLRPACMTCNAAEGSRLRWERARATTERSA
jgi:5-methylcytosine-specific restriction endonuclease McrA